MSDDKREYGSDWLYAEDLLSKGFWTEATVKIIEFIEPNTLTTAREKKVDKPAIRVGKTGKLLALCETNKRTLRNLIGDRDVSKSVGHEITIFAAMVQSPTGGKCPGIRIRLPDKDRYPQGVRKWLGEDLTGKSVSQPQEK